MPYSSRQVGTALTNKLGFEDESDRRHRRFMRVHQGRIVGLTYISHGAAGRDITEGLLSTMARQLRVTGPQFRAAIDCRIDADGFLQLLLAPRRE